MADLKDIDRGERAPRWPCAKTISAPAQVAAVLDAVDADVLDRTELILTVFSKHAHSLEGTMQVHLAQLEYELTRMRGKGLMLSRLGAGVDMRGPGETKMEVDRRVVRKRIQTLRSRIDQMARTRRTQRAAASAPASRSSPSPATPTPASRRCSTRSRTPRSRCATASSRRSTPRRAPIASTTATT